MARVTVDLDECGKSLLELMAGLAVEADTVDGSEILFSGPLDELEVLLHRANGCRGLDDYANRLKSIEE